MSFVEGVIDWTVAGLLTLSSKVLFPCDFSWEKLIDG